MTGAILISVPPTVGHVNHGIALGRLAVRAGLRAVLITGTGMAGYLHGVTAGESPEPITARCVPSHDFNADRADPRYRPHLEQVCDAARLRAATADELAAIADCGALAVVGKDSPASVIAASAAGLPYWAYYTDGAESLAADTNRQTVSNPALVRRQLVTAAHEFGVRDLPWALPGLFRSSQLNIVRGLAETTLAGVEPPGVSDATIMFAGALTFDGSDALISGWARDLARLPRPVSYVTFGTVLRDRSRFAALAGASAGLPGTIVIASPLREPREVTFPPNVMIAAYIPNEAALRVASVVVHHGGHGTMLSALAHGVPQLVIPDNPRSNQAHHGKALERLGLGLIVDQADAGEQLAAATARLMAAEVREAANAFAAHVRQRTDQLCAAIVSRFESLHTENSRR